MVILGIDPGFCTTGFSVLAKLNRGARLLDYGHLSLSSSDSVQRRIGLFYDFFTDKLITFGITHIALETPFLGKNARSFLMLGYLRGIVYLLGEQHRVIVHDFAPREIKQMVTGYGGASKEQVAKALLSYFPTIDKHVKNDVTDALAVTMCSFWYHNKRSAVGGKV